MSNDPIITSITNPKYIPGGTEPATLSFSSAYGFQSMVEQVFMNQANNLLYNQMVGLQSALAITESAVNVLTNLQNLHNQVSVVTKPPLSFSYANTNITSDVTDATIKTYISAYTRAASAYYNTPVLIQPTPLAAGDIPSLNGVSPDTLVTNTLGKFSAYMSSLTPLFGRDFDTTEYSIRGKDGYFFVNPRNSSYLAVSQQYGPLFKDIAQQVISHIPGAYVAWYDAPDDASNTLMRDSRLANSDYVNSSLMRKINSSLSLTQAAEAAQLFRTAIFNLHNQTKLGNNLDYLNYFTENFSNLNGSFNNSTASSLFDILYPSNRVQAQFSAANSYFNTYMNTHTPTAQTDLISANLLLVNRDRPLFSAILKDVGVPPGSQIAGINTLKGGNYTAAQATALQATFNIEIFMGYKSTLSTNIIPKLRLSTPSNDQNNPNTLLGKLTKVLADMNTNNPRTTANGITTWLIDGYNDTGGVGATNAGNINQAIVGAITAAQSLNTTQTSQVSNGLLLYQQYYQCAAKLLSQMTRMMEQIAQNIK